MVFLSDKSGLIKPLIKSIEIVELETSTKAARVDIDAERISTIIIPIKASGNALSNIRGTTISD